MQCGQPIAPNNGFHFRGFGYTQIGDTVESLIKYSIGWDNNPSDAAAIAKQNNRATVLPLIMAAIDTAAARGHRKRSARHR